MKKRILSILISIYSFIIAASGNLPGEEASDTLSKKTQTSSIATITGDDLRNLATPELTHALQGRLAGVQLQQTSSKPGTSMQIRIRGTHSLTNSNNPLIVLNGIPFPGELYDIDPNAISQIDVLKDVAATAIYGSRGANGVIQISTYKGEKSTKAQLSYNTFTGIKKAIKYPMMNTAEFAALRDSVGLYLDGLDESRDVDTDWQEEFYRPATITSHDLRIAGGTKKGNYNFGFGYLLDQAVIPTQQFQRYSLRFSIDQEIGKYFRFGITSHNNFSFTEGTQIRLYNILSASPMLNPYNEDGTTKDILQMPLDYLYVLTRDKIEDFGEEWVSETKAYGTNTNIFSELKIPGIKGLKYRVNAGLNLRTDKSGKYTGRGVNRIFSETPSQASVQESQFSYRAIENQLSYNRTFIDKHWVKVIASYLIEEAKDSLFGARAQNVASSAMSYEEIKHSASVLYGEYGSSKLHSFAWQFNYSLSYRYLLKATIYSDGSTLSNPEKEKFPNYGVSLGWNLGEEAFMQDVAFINQLKIRAGYGKIYHQTIASPSYGNINADQYNLSSLTFASGYYIAPIISTSNSREHSKTYSYGVDFALFKSRFHGSFDYFTTQTEDVLINIGLPINAALSGYTNLGELRNKGIELSLNGTIIESINGFGWDAGINLYSNKNEILALASGQEMDLSNWWFVGQPINVIYDYEYAGLWQAGEPYRNILESGSDEETLGMIKVKYHGEYDANGIPVRRIGPDDRIPIPVDPKFLGGFNTRLVFNGWDINVIAAFQKGGTLISTLHTANGYLNMLSGRRNNIKVEYWTPQNPNVRYPRPTSKKSGDNPAYGNTLGYFDASYLKIQALTLGYNFYSMAWAKNSGISKLRVYISAQNILTLFSSFHHETGLDPQTNSFGDENAAVNNTYKHRLLTLGANTPSSKNYLFGINVTF